MVISSFFRDQFILEEDGYGKVVGRLKEMIIRGGENIFPKEIEEFLNSHPNILETHVGRKILSTSIYFMSLSIPDFRSAAT